MAISLEERIEFLQLLRRNLLRDDDTLWRILANRKYRPCSPGKSAWEKCVLLGPARRVISVK